VGSDSLLRRFRGRGGARSQRRVTVDRFAALVPPRGGDPSAVRAIQHLPVWGFHGALEPAIPLQRSIAGVATQVGFRRAFDSLSGLAVTPSPRKRSTSTAVASGTVRVRARIYRLATALLTGYALPAKVGRLCSKAPAMPYRLATALQPVMHYRPGWVGYAAGHRL